MDSRLESLIMEAEWLVTNAVARDSDSERSQRNRRVERYIIQIDKILKLDPEILDDCRPAIEKIMLYGLKNARERKCMMTAALSIATQTSKYHACQSTEKVFDRLLHVFERLHAAKKIEYIYELSCISQTLQNILLGNGIRKTLEEPRQLEALLNICERGFDYDTPEISSKLIMAIMFKWPKATGIKATDDQFATVMENFLRLILVKLEVENITNRRSRLYLMFAMICVFDNARELLRVTFIKVLKNQMNLSDEMAEQVYETYLIKWFEISTDEHNLRTDLALISCRVLRRIIVTPAKARPKICEEMASLLVPKSIYIIDNLIGRLKRLFAPSYDTDDSYILRLSPFDRLIPITLYRFFTATRMSSDIAWQQKLMGSIEEHSQRRLMRIVDFLCSRTTIEVYTDGKVVKISLQPHPEHIWRDYIEQALEASRNKQTASIGFHVDTANVAKRIKWE